MHKYAEINMHLYAVSRQKYVKVCQNMPNMDSIRKNMQKNCKNIQIKLRRVLV